jgi:hypothetical protein
MAGAETNVEDVCAKLRRLNEVGSYSGPGRYKTFGEDLQDAIAQGLVIRYVLDQQEPGGKRLAELAESTLREKQRKGYPETIGVRTGLMLNIEQLKGELLIEGGTLTMTYGREEAARQEMVFFTEGSRRKNRRQPPRSLGGERE